jgi:hypothetical protein
LPPTKTRALGNARLIKAMSHPFRAMALTVLSERVASPKELSEELDEQLHRAAYHVRVLKELGCIEEVATKQRRGATEHYYRAVERSVLWGRYWAEVPMPAREGFAASVIRNSFTDSATAFDAGTFEARPDRHLSRTPLLLDEEGWLALTKLYDETLDATLEIQAESAERMSRGEPGIHVEAVQMCFEMPEKPRPNSIGR